MTKRTLNGFCVVAVLVAATSAAFAVSSDRTPAPGAAPTAADTAVEKWPMKLDQFLKGDYLDRADIMLTRRDWDLSSFIIRWSTNSPFSHSALIFNRPNQEPGIANTFVIEAGTSGVDLTNLRDYAADKSAYIAIKRFRGTWFDEPKQARVRGLLLDKIKASYNYWAIGRIAKSLWFGVQNKMNTDSDGKSQREKTMEKYKQKAWVPPSEFICSGLVQTGYVETVMEFIRSGDLPPSAIAEVVFNRNAQDKLPDDKGWSDLGTARGRQLAESFAAQNTEALESVTPDDLAQSRKLEWLYFIKGDEVHKVRTYAQVKVLIDK
jgi:Permuted papain-like amidase enzyme, YaeF/YiiX, C92 family